MASIRNCTKIAYKTPFGGAFARLPLALNSCPHHFAKSAKYFSSRAGVPAQVIGRGILKNLSTSISSAPHSPIIFSIQPLRGETTFRRTFTCSSSQFSPISRGFRRSKSKLGSDSSENGSKNDGEGGDGNQSNGNGGGGSGGSDNPSSGNKGDGSGKGGDGSGDSSPPRSPFEGIQRTLHVLETTLQKPSIPEVYPQVLALPIARRPLFPGFYKAVVIKDPHVTAAVKELMKRGQPYVGAFLLKDEELDVDTITDIAQIYNVGVFAQITSVFPANGSQDENSLTAVLYPHRRIRITELLPPLSSGVSEADIVSESAKQNPETANKNKEHEPQYATSFLEDYNVSLVNVENLNDETYNRKNQVIRAITSEIVAVFKDIATLNPLFRDQIANFSMSQSAGNVFEEPAKLADFAAAVSTGEPNELQEVLESLVIEERLQKALLVLKKELVNAQLQSKISKEVESKIAKRQREYYLMEQLKGIKKELGIESDGKDKLGINISSSFVKKFKIENFSSTPHNPSANVLVEAFNKTIYNLLKKMVSKNKRDWHECLIDALRAFQITVWRATQVAPLFLVYEYEAILALDKQISSLRIALYNEMIKVKNTRLRL